MCSGLQMSPGTLVLSAFLFTNLSVMVSWGDLITTTWLLNLRASSLHSRQKEGKEKEAKEQRMKRSLPARLHLFIQKWDCCSISLARIRIHGDSDLQEGLRKWSL